jgi:catechol 2,3-dioxygenase-like lactoylglutathione lyase family enzyme
MAKGGLAMLFKQKEKEKKYINPRFRAYGKARLDIAQRAKTRQDWEALWKSSTNPYPFTWGDSWKHCVEYKVDDFAAEVGFFVDILGLPVNAFDLSYAMFTSPGEDFFIGIVPAAENIDSTPKDAIRLQFMVADIIATTKELERRGVIIEQQPVPCQPGSSLHIGYFRTPHGIPVELWGQKGRQVDRDDLDLGDEFEDESADDQPLEITLGVESKIRSEDSDESNLHARENNNTDEKANELIIDRNHEQEPFEEHSQDDEVPGYEYFYEDEPLIN